jgi:hypothetical protein
MHESIQAGLALLARHSAVGNGRNFQGFKGTGGLQRCSSMGGEQSIRQVTGRSQYPVHRLPVLVTDSKR